VDGRTFFGRSRVEQEHTATVPDRVPTGDKPVQEPHAGARHFFPHLPCPPFLELPVKSQRVHPRVESVINDLMRILPSFGGKLLLCPGQRRPKLRSPRRQFAQPAFLLTPRTTLKFTRNSYSASEIYNRKPEASEPDFAMQLNSQGACGLCKSNWQ